MPIPLDPFLFDEATYNLHYNCSFYDIDSIPIQKRQHPLLGTLILAIYFVSVSLYIPCVTIMCTTGLRKRSSYQLMILLGIIDIVDLTANSLIFGVLSISGAVFCSSSTLLYIHGLVCLSAWFGSTITTLILSINRCCELHSRYMADKFFSGKMNYFWIILVLLYMLGVPLFGIAPVFDGVMMSMFFNPHNAYFVDTEQTYASEWHTYHNMFVCVSHTTTYAIFIMLYVRRVSGAVRKTIRDKNTYIQVLTIGFFHFTASFSYVLEQFVPVGFYGCLAATFTYILSTALPPFVYITFNKSIKTSLLQIGKKIMPKDVRSYSATRPSTLTSSQDDHPLH
uniref:Serpentine Receptor, class T n=2 Tax=Bursaphelenchus xylophilus TaxID=6326 RepID=A0A1I7RIS6_BURXY